VTLERLERLGGSGGALAHVRVQVSVDQVSVDDEAGAADRPVLDWRPVVVLA
jgi:hypothetical protein